MRRHKEPLRTQQLSRRTIFQSQIPVVLLVLLGMGCASVKYTRIENECDDSSATGIRYFDTSPYLLLQKDTNGVWNSQLLYLPDDTKKYQIKPFTLLSVNNTTFTFTNAILTGATAEIDTSAVPAAFIQAAAKAAELLIKAEAQPQRTPETREPDVQLFKIVRTMEGWGVIGAGAPRYEDQFGGHL